MAKKQSQPTESLAAQLPTDRLKQEAQGLVDAARHRAVSAVTDRVDDAAKRLTSYADGSGASSLLSAVTGNDGKPPGGAMVSAGLSGVKEKVTNVFKGGGDGGGGRDTRKVTNIVETIDIGAPLRLVYNQWTQFTDFSGFMKKVENVEQESEEKLMWKAQVLWSHRTWESTIVEQVPDSRIVWQSQGEKGSVDGAVTFHEIAPELTRVVLVLEYYPQGLFERTGNIWRAQGRRARLELKHFRRHVMTRAVLHPEEIQGWRGEIHDSEVTKEHEPESEDSPAEGDQPAEEDQSAEEDEPARKRTSRSRRSGSSGRGRSSGSSRSAQR